MGHSNNTSGEELIFNFEWNKDCRPGCQTKAKQVTQPRARVTVSSSFAICFYLRLLLPSFFKELILRDVQRNDVILSSKCWLLCTVSSCEDSAGPSPWWIWQILIVFMPIRKCMPRCIKREWAAQKMDPCSYSTNAAGSDLMQLFKGEKVSVGCICGRKPQQGFLANQLLEVPHACQWTSWILPALHNSTVFEWTFPSAMIRGAGKACWVCTGRRALETC